ncbi:ABC transporter ATP-binding protein [Desulfonatronum parangueonense]
MSGSEGRGQDGAYLQVRDLCKGYGTGAERREVLRDVSFEVRRGEILALLGASGCGKTTLLNIVAGFLTADQGNVAIQGRLSEGPGPDKAVIFQEDALFPWLTVEENVSFGLRVNSVSRTRRREIARRMLDLVGLAGRESMLPDQLSGGMRQRVALARVLALEPKLLLMDEPFAALDALTREDMHDLLLALHADFQPAVVFVTHDVVEAVKLADQVLVMGGRGIDERTTLSDKRPRDPESAAFIDNVRYLRRILRQIYDS